MDEAVRAWLFMQLGRDTPLADLVTRYQRLGSARAVALEILGERLAAILANPGTVNVNGVVSISYAANIQALERQIALLRDGIPTAPDDPDTDGDGLPGGSSVGIIRLIERPRR